MGGNAKRYFLDNDFTFHISRQRREIVMFSSSTLTYLLDAENDIVP
jgi:hypothetical protein